MTTNGSSIIGTIWSHGQGKGDTAYYWHDGQVKIIQFKGSKTVAKGYHDAHMVDTRYSEPEARYGMYQAHKFGSSLSGWTHLPLDKFPAEFRAALLLLGIT